MLCYNIIYADVSTHLPETALELGAKFEDVDGREDLVVLCDIRIELLCEHQGAIRQVLSVDPHERTTPPGLLVP